MGLGLEGCAAVSADLCMATFTSKKANSSWSFSGRKFANPINEILNGNNTRSRNSHYGRGALGRARHEPSRPTLLRYSSPQYYGETRVNLLTPGWPPGTQA